MPEGDTVYKLSRYLGPALGGREILAGFAIAGERVDLAGRRVERIYAVGKHLFIALDRRELLRSHLGMWGSWHGYAPGEPWRRPRERAAIVIETGERVFVCFQPAQVELLRADGVRARTLEARLGPDLLAPPVDLSAVVARARGLSGPGRTIADLLLDQRVACGIGNVYKSETLFLGACHPERSAGSIEDGQLAALYDIAAGLLAGNRRHGPRVTRRDRQGDQGLWVYGRSRLPCHRCGTPIVGRLLGAAQRSTYWCPRCQPLRTS
jgi:endonuclease-8